MDRIRFVHVVSDEFLRPAIRPKEKYTSFEVRVQKHESKKVATELLQLLEDYDLIDLEEVFEEKALAKYQPDINMFRRYTFALTFPNIEEGDLNTVVVAFARQANGDQFSKEFGRNVTRSRLLRFLDDGHTKNNKRDGDFVFETSISDVQAGKLNLPEKVLGTILSTHRSLEKRVENGTISELGPLADPEDSEE